MAQHCTICGRRILVDRGDGRCWRHRIPARKPHRARKDPVTASVYDQVRHRDGWGCAGPAAGLEGACGGPIELDHVLNGGMGLRGPSDVGNLVSLCRDHHRWKTEHAQLARRLLVAHLSVLRDPPGEA